MKNIFNIFKNDLLAIKNNVIALIVVIGIIVVPSLYAWFNIGASWDPYNKTNMLKVAVVSEDEGYKTSLIPVNINMGENVLTSLRKNNKLEWVFTKKKSAINGVKSGKYYAAIIIPKNFSTDMMSLFTEEMHHPHIKYYYNGKKNAIAPKITDKGASGLQMEINKVFISTISDTLISSIKLANNVGDSVDADTLSSSILVKLNDISKNLNTAANTLNAFESLSLAGVDILNVTSSFSENNSEDKIIKSLQNTNNNISNAKNNLDKASSTISSALEKTNSMYDNIETSASTVLGDITNDKEFIASVLNNEAEKINKVKTNYETIVSALNTIKNNNEDKILLTSKIDSLTTKLNISIDLHDKLYKKLVTSASNLTSSQAQINEDLKSISDLISSSKTNMTDIQSTYKDEVENDLSDLSSSLSSNNNSIIDLLNKLKEDKKVLSKNNADSKENLNDVSTSLNHSAEILKNASESIDLICNNISEAKKSGDYDSLNEFLQGNTGNISSFISSPVKLDTKKIYKTDNYGSAMAPFYTTLSIWVGGVVLVAIMKCNTSKKFSNSKNYEKYFGRYLLFLLLGFLQTMLIVLGDLYFLEIQCNNPGLFILTALISSLVYVNIIYTLTISFGDVGKALSVILLVIQVAGTGGTFPIECAPTMFRKIYHLLPFTYSMTAMRECLFGLYGSTAKLAILKLLAFLIPSLLLGLIFRNPIIELNNLFTEKLEDTKIM